MTKSEARKVLADVKRLTGEVRGESVDRLRELKTAAQGAVAVLEGAPAVIVVIGLLDYVRVFDSPDSMRSDADRLESVFAGGPGSALAKELRAIADQADAAATHGETEAGFRWKLCTVQ